MRMTCKIREGGETVGQQQESYCAHKKRRPGPAEEGYLQLLRQLGRQLLGGQIKPPRAGRRLVRVPVLGVVRVPF